MEAWRTLRFWLAHLHWGHARQALLPAEKNPTLLTVVIFAAKVAKGAAGQAPEPVKEAPLKKRC